MPHASIDGLEIHYERHGDAGEPLVLVHGYTGDMSDWRHQVTEFSRDHRVLVMDHRGHGRSGAPRGRAAYTVARISDDVETLVDLVGFDRYHLVGHSLGGFVGQEIALRSAERLLSLTLEDSTPDFEVGRLDGVRAFYDARLRLAEAEGMAAVAAIPNPTPPPHLPPARVEEERIRLSKMSVDAFAGTWQGLCDWPGTRARAHAIRTRTLVVWGELDAAFARGSQWLAETVPGASAEVIPEAAHSPQFERPDLFNAALRRHLGA